MRKILILTGRYLPGYKDGGPLRTLFNITESLGDEYEFYIICLDRDHGDETAYPNILRNDWNQVGKAKVWYISPGGWTFAFLKKMTHEMDVVYLTSFYDAYGYKTLLLHKIGLIKQCKIALASMGVFSEGALSHKSFKKNIFINLCKTLGLFRNITWSVTSELEKKDVERCIGGNLECVIAEDLPRNSVPGIKKREERKIKKIIFLSRICPQKNLLFAIKILQNVNAEVIFDIYGPIQDGIYWNKCKEELKKLSKNVKWSYKGNANPEKVQEIFSEYDVFLFPTMGENYGHVIFEALSVGCIPVISDQTPWKEIDKKNAGYTLGLTQIQEYSKAIEALVDMDPYKKMKMAQNAVQIAIDKVEQNRKETGYRKIFG